MQQFSPPDFSHERNFWISSADSVDGHKADERRLRHGDTQDDKPGEFERIRADHTPRLLSQR
jgi:hypothetical protein